MLRVPSLVFVIEIAMVVGISVRMMVVVEMNAARNVEIAMAVEMIVEMNV